MERAEISVSGLVQGVGFREGVRRIAWNLGLAGHVKDLDDGTVEIVCEGPQARITDLIERARALAPPVYVDDMQIKYADAQGPEKFDLIRGDLAREMAYGFMYMYSPFWSRDLDD